VELFTQPVDIRAGIDRLSLHVQQALGRPPCDGTVYVFSNRRHTRLKVVCWDGNDVSPLFDRLYIFDITIHDAYRRRGFGLAVMSYLATTYRLQITTIKEVSQASGFWHSVRLAGAPIDTLSFSEMDTEAERWAHLKPHADKLELLICDRLFRNCEAWETAVGRGLPDWPSSTPRGPGAREQP